MIIRLVENKSTIRYDNDGTLSNLNNKFMKLLQYNNMKERLQKWTFYI